MRVFGGWFGGEEWSSGIAWVQNCLKNKFKEKNLDKNQQKSSILHTDLRALHT